MAAIENVVSPERIPIVREGDTFVMKLHVDDDAWGKKINTRELAIIGEGRYERMEVNAANAEEVVFRRLSLPWT